MKIIFKLDDLRENNYYKFDKVCKIAQRYNIHITIGIINDSLKGNNKDYINWIIETNKKENVTFWNHGLIHKKDKVTRKSEYEESYESQKKNLLETHELGKEKLGLEYKIFGSPYNISDNYTINILEELEYNFMFFPNKNSESYKIKLLKNRIDMEKETGVVIDKKVFKKNYLEMKDNGYSIIQGHPNIWSEDSFINFEEIIKLLISEKCKITKVESILNV